MNFDFNEIPEVDDSEEFFKEIDAMIWNKFHEITDIPELCSNPRITTTVQKKGYWEADRYFTIHLVSQLKKLGLEEFAPETKYRGGTITSPYVHGLIGFLGNSLVFCFGPNVDVRQSLELVNFKDEYEEKGIKMIENSPIIVFQHYVGPIIPNEYKDIELDQEAYHCIKDAVVFKGVYKATKAEGKKYNLKRMFDTYIFDSNGFWHFNPNRDASGIETKYKSIKADTEVL